MSRKRRLLWMSTEKEDQDERICRAMDSDGQIRVLLPSGAMATVAPDVSLKTLMALDRMAALAIAHCLKEQSLEEQSLEETKGLLP